MTSSSVGSTSFISDWNSRISLTHEFLSTSERPKYVFGCNSLAQRISALVKVHGFIDDITQSSTFEGLPVIRSVDVPPNSIVVSAIIGVLPVSVERHLHNLLVDHIDYFAFSKISKLDLAAIPFWEGAHEDMRINLARYKKIADRMGDEVSQRTMSDLISFRYEMNLEYMIGYTNRQHEQYFEPFLQLDRMNLNFFDLGCFDGFTSAEFARLSPQYSSISAFEPMSRLHSDCCNNLRELRNCVVHNFGASDLEQSLIFVDDGSSSTVSSGEGELVSLKRLDDLTLPRPDLIKIDIEGAELQALRGMSGILQESRPMMAIACYHYPNEILEIVDFWDSIGLTGALELRHYTEGTTETVLFIVPNGDQ